MDARHSTPTEGATPRVPRDLGAVAGLAVVAVVVSLAPDVVPTPVRAALVLPLLVLLPGYAFLAAADAGAVGRGTTRLDRLDRALLSVGLSLGLVALGSIALAFSPWGLTRTSVVAAAAAFTVAAAAVAVSRRAAVPFDDRPAPASLASLLPVRRGGRGATVANAAVVLALVVFVASVGFAASVPGGTDPYTGFSVSAVDAGGAPVTPGLLAPGSESTLTVTVGNEEAATVAYAVVVTRERVVADADGGLTVVGSEAVGRYEFTLADGGTWSGDHLAVVPEEGRYRFTFALYRDGAAGEPYRQLVVHSRG